MHLNKFLALVYSDLFDFPLSKKELELWSISNNGYKIKNRSSLNSRVCDYQGYYVLCGREKLIGFRRQREKITLRKEILARKYADFLSKILFVQAVFLTGSVAVGNAKKEADIDLLVIVSPNTLWVSRLLIVSFLKLMRVYRDKKSTDDRVCTNLYLDMNNLEAKEKNLFTAHEIMQAKCLFDRNEVQFRWLKINSWVENYLPVAYKYFFDLSNSQLQIKNKSKLLNPNLLTIVGYWILDMAIGFINSCAFVVQYVYQKPKQTNEKIGWGYAYFHPNNLSCSIMDRFNKQIDG